MVCFSFAVLDIVHVKEKLINNDGDGLRCFSSGDNIDTFQNKVLNIEQH